MYQIIIFTMREDPPSLKIMDYIGILLEKPAHQLTNLQY